MSTKKGFSVAVSLTSKGYPGKYEKDKLITGIESTEKKYVNVDVYHAGTKINENGKLVTNGGRVLTVNAVSETLKGAIASAYEAVEKIKFEGKTYRSDIAAKGLLKIKK
jgi:phosphoribosylamine--glycine ligase